MPKPNLVLDYIPPIGNTGEVIGMDVAVDGLQRACLRHASGERIGALSAAPQIYEHFEKTAAEEKAKARPTAMAWHAPDGWIGFDTVLRADPALHKPAWLRERLGSNRLSLIGLSHTQSSAEVIAATASLMSAPLQPWDAIICPSPAIRDVVEQLLSGYGEHLARRTGGSPPPLPQLPEIPLGVDTAHFAFPDGERARIRARFDIPDDMLVILYHGRMSYHSKANPGPLAIAAERLVKQGRKIALLFHGFFLPDSVEADYRRVVGALAPSVPHAFVQHGDPAFPNGLWAGADVFTSPADNIQESFGLTPVEAMAAGLPAVISDWDGYRATVRDGVDGFLIPTLGPEPGTGRDLAARYEDGRDVYGEHIGGLAQSVVVDIDALTTALDRLAADPALRATMGAAGRERARTVFDWAAIVPRIEDLAGNLTDIRNATHGPKQAGPSPLAPDPTTLFRTFPTRHLDEKTEIVLMVGSFDDVEALLAHRACSIHPPLIADAAQRRVLFDALSQSSSMTLADILKQCAEIAPAIVQRTLLNWAKFGLVRMR